MLQASCSVIIDKHWKIDRHCKKAKKQVTVFFTLKACQKWKPARFTVWDKLVWFAGGPETRWEDCLELNNCQSLQRAFNSLWPSDIIQAWYFFKSTAIIVSMAKRTTGIRPDAAISAYSGGKLNFPWPTENLNFAPIMRMLNWRPNLLFHEQERVKKPRQKKAKYVICFESGN